MIKVYNSLCKFIFHKLNENDYICVKKITDTCLLIYDTIDTDKYIIKIIIAVSFLYNLFEQYYSECRQLLLDNKYTNNDINLIINIISKLSYDNEVKEKKENEKYLESWEKLLGKEGLLIRDIVSDSDRLEAINNINIYIHYYNNDMNKVKQFYDEKIILLLDYMRTDFGKKRAKLLYNSKIYYIHNYLLQNKNIC